MGRGKIGLVFVSRSFSGRTTAPPLSLLTSTCLSRHPVYTQVSSRRVTRAWSLEFCCYLAATPIRHESSPFGEHRLGFPRSSIDRSLTHRAEYKRARAWIHTHITRWTYSTLTYTDYEVLPGDAKLRYLSFFPFRNARDSP